MLPMAPYWKSEDVKSDLGVAGDGWKTWLDAGLTPINGGRKEIVTFDNLMETLRVLVALKRNVPPAEKLIAAPQNSQEAPKARKRRSVSEMTLDDLRKRERMTTSMVAKYVGCSIQTVTRAMEKGILIPVGGLTNRPEFKRTQVDEVRDRLPVDGRKRKAV